MLRHLDIKLVVIASLGVAAFGLVILLQNFGLNNVPDENIVYINPAVGGIEADDLPNEEIAPREIVEGSNELEEPGSEVD